jgi:hypothetical protein
MKNLSPLTKLPNIREIYTQKQVPLFQNKVFINQQLAINAEKKEVTLAQCLDTGFVFSLGFDPSILNYDDNYQNEQSNSAFFQEHMQQVIQWLNENQLLNNQKIIEIGCGKAYFMNLLLELGHEVIGIDPTYEGESSNVLKEYYSEKHAYLQADLIILRHTLEHISNPFEFIKMIAHANQRRGSIYIEIPTFDWIVKNKAVEDIFYEHCNYFTPSTISQLFNKCQIKYLFNGQYIGILAQLADIKEKIENIKPIENHSIQFEEKLNKYRNIIEEHSNIALWGAGAKGSTFLNLLDPDKDKIKCVVDINPKKQKRFIAGTGHPIISPEEIDENNIKTVILMNSNYKNEVEQTLTHQKLICL